MTYKIKLSIKIIVLFIFIFFANTVKLVLVDKTIKSRQKYGYFMVYFDLFITDADNNISPRAGNGL